MLLLAGGGLAVVVYRELIAPLRVKLVESQALVERQEKLASLGLLAAGVAHEIRNPLTAIKAWLFLQQKHLQPGTPEHTDTEVIANEVSRLERIVKDVLLLARPDEPKLMPVAAEEPLRQVQALLKPQLEKTGIRLACADCVSARVQIDAQQIQQVLINLIQNAADSIGRDGDITLRARLGTPGSPSGSTEVVILEVADTGKGIPPDVQKRLFDPFFTTKDSGTGLGLSIAARIVEKHGGALQYQTQPNRGTTFGIVPCLTSPATMSSAANILLIEDDRAIVVSLRRLLAEEGYAVLVETRGDTGLARAREADVDVVITDMRLPGLGGLELIRQLHAAKPRLPIILITGHGTTETAIEATKLGAYDYMLKPLELPQFLALVAKAVASRRLMTEPVELGTPHRGARRPGRQQPRRCRRFTRRLAASPPSRSTSSSAARPARARNSSPAPSISTATAPRPRSSPSTAPPSPRPCSRANSSATSAAPSPAPRAAALAASSRPTTAPSSSTKSAT